jgi:hypothetical protein
MGLRSTLKDKAMGLSQQALERLLSDEGRAQKVAEAVGAVQGAKARLDATQRALMSQLSLATKGDFKELGKGVSRLTKRVRRLAEKLGARG